MTSVGENIKNIRKKNNITQEELAEKLNVTRQAVSNWENGKTEPDIETFTNRSHNNRLLFLIRLYNKCRKKSRNVLLRG